jgi:ATPase subunit of ABC transporter with duplicated ATPase domains
MPCGYCQEEGHNRATCPQLSGMSIEERRSVTRNAQNVRSHEQAIQREAERRRQHILFSQEYRQREEQRREQARQRQEQIDRETRARRERERRIQEERRTRRIEWCLTTFSTLVSHYNDTSNLDELFTNGQYPEGMIDLIGTRATNEIMLMNYHKIKASEKELVNKILEPKEAVECPICMEELTQTDLFVTRCGHSYHGGCLMKHLTRHDNCPCCRGVII